MKTGRHYGCNKRNTFILLAIIFVSVFVIPGTALAIIVTSTADAGPGSLRQAMLDARVDGISTPITFNPAVFPESTPATINLVSRLPAITDIGDSIDASGSGVIIDGAAVVPLNTAVGIRVRASKVTIRKLTIRNFPHNGISVSPVSGASGVFVTGVTIVKNVIAGNLDGLAISGGAGPGNTVDVSVLKNLLDKNRDDGIVAAGSSGAITDGGNVMTVIIDKNTIIGSLGVVTGGTRTGDAIRVFGAGGDGQNNKVTTRITRNKGYDNADDGIVVAGAGGRGGSNNSMVAVIAGNLMKDNGDIASTNGNGIVVRAGNRSFPVTLATNNIIEFFMIGNKTRNNKDTGIVIAGGWGSNHTVSGTVIANLSSDNGLDGVRVSGSNGNLNVLSKIKLSLNAGLKNGRHGLHINGGSGIAASLNNISVSSNVMYANGRNGIQVVTGSGAGNSVSVSRITYNRANVNGLDGIYTGPGVPGGMAGTPVKGNRADFNGQDGIDIDSVGYVLGFNRANKNTADGINAIGNTNSGGNVAVNNAGCNTPGCY